MNRGSAQVCVYCGGDAHPAECGYPEYDGRFWFGYVMAVLAVAWACALVLDWLL